MCACISTTHYVRSTSIVFIILNKEKEKSKESKSISIISFLLTSTVLPLPYSSCLTRDKDFMSLQYLSVVN